MKKPCEKPMKMHKLEALSRRLSPNHPKQKKITVITRKSVLVLTENQVLEKS